MIIANIQRHIGDRIIQSTFRLVEPSSKNFDAKTIRDMARRGEFTEVMANQPVKPYKCVKGLDGVANFSQSEFFVYVLLMLTNYFITKNL